MKRKRCGSVSININTKLLCWMAVAVPSSSTSSAPCSAFLLPSRRLHQQLPDQHQHHRHRRLHAIDMFSSSPSSLQFTTLLNLTAHPNAGASNEYSIRGQRQRSRRHIVNATSSWSTENVADDIFDEATENADSSNYITTKKLKRKTSTTPSSSTTSSSFTTVRQSPFPAMPSPLFVDLAKSQFELLSNSLVHTTTTTTTTSSSSKQQSKIHSMILYLPKENPITGRLEFVPALSIPDPSSSSNHKRIFIASSVEHSSKSGGVHQPPTVPEFVMQKGALRLPGFFSAKDLIPSYPFVSSGSNGSDEEGGSAEVLGMEEGDDGKTTKNPQRSRDIITMDGYDSPIGVSAVEEIPMMSSSSSKRSSSGGLGESVEADVKGAGGGGGGCRTSLSVTLFNGLDTLGVLMLWPNNNDKMSNNNNEEEQEEWKWTSEDKRQVSRAAKSLALALSMDGELASSRLANDRLCVAMADGLHQVKSPLQALRTFGKLLRRQLDEDGSSVGVGSATIVGMERMPTATTSTSAGNGRGRRHALKLAEDMLSQGERVIDIIEPMDALVRSSSGDGNSRYLLRGDILEIEEETSMSTLRLPPSDDVTTEIPQQYLLPPPMPIIGDFTLEMAFPQDVLGSIVYASQAVSREAGINFDVYGFDPDNIDLPGVSVCTKYLKEAVSNLLDNAIKYAPIRRRGKVGRPRTPQIKVSLVPNDRSLFSPGATIYIEDNGPGISPSEREKVFERGYRGEAVQDEVDGSGLGLAIAREMISKIGGTLEIVDVGPNKLNGTTVRVVLFRDPER
ncbi:hypothetical protein ACHAWU_001835 [Discostella pseudostelligera]|uniref:Histidine kinase domain-containing protein n=1 Tax=Discostella pseudostelligera TaxID=259834 RepID=A0ABD3MIY5_9STRA